MPVTCDVAIIGGGPAGYVGAIRGAQLGGRIVLIEKEHLGGTCLNRGCIPSKALLDAAQRYLEFQADEAFGLIPGAFSYDFSKVQERKNKVVAQLRSGTESLVKSNGITLLRGSAQFADPHRLTIQLTDGGTEEVQAANVVIATGSIEARPPIPGLDRQGVFGSDEGLNLPEIPQSVVIVGGGPLGCEFASVFRGFGAEVTIVEMMPTLVPNEDPEIGKALGQAFQRRGLQVRTGAKVDRVEGEPGAMVVIVTREGSTETLRAEKVMVAIGRTPFTDGLGLERIGISTRGRAIVADDHLRTNVPGVYAAGDVIGVWMYAHAAFMECEIAVENALGGDRAMDYRAVPNVTFSFPQVASVGLNEERARASGQAVKVGRFPFAAAAKAVVDGTTEGFVKVVTDEKYGQILGASIIGPDATGLIAEMALAITLESTIEDITQTIHAHPTLPEAIKEASLDVDGRAIHIFRRRR